ncbi:MAG: hypothetical protein IPK58_24135 [Acidobacteria bacterium]|nr:hypothetical protein [Acidobacteriota bacterium]
MRTAILSKNDMIALLCVKTADQGGAICRVDPREPTPSVQLYDDPAKALEWFHKSLRTSRRNGWQLVYDGLPLKVNFLFAIIYASGDRHQIRRRSSVSSTAAASETLYGSDDPREIGVRDLRIDRGRGRFPGRTRRHLVGRDGVDQKPSRSFRKSASTKRP